MNKIKTFTVNSPKKLDKEVNKWLDENQNIIINDIKFSTLYRDDYDEEYAVELHAMVYYSDTITGLNL